MKNIVIIGGGTGTFVALSGLKKYPVNLSAIITMADSGGSTGKLRDQLGVLPPGDLRQALVALSESDQIWRDLFLYRFDNGDFNGHNFGNIFLSTLEKVSGSIEQAIEHATKILDVKGQVIPVTYSKVDLCVELVDGTFVIGETHIDEPAEFENRPKIKRAFLQPSVSANKKAFEAIQKADLIVIGPGDLYTSLIPNLLVEGIVDTIKKSKAKKAYFVNLMTKLGQTTNYTATDHVNDLEKYLGKNVLDFVILNNKELNSKALGWYEGRGEKQVEDDIINSKYKVIREDILNISEYKKDTSDKLVRSLLRHDSEKIANVILSLVRN